MLRTCELPDKLLSSLQSDIIKKEMTWMYMNIRDSPTLHVDTNKNTEQLVVRQDMNIN